MKPRPIPVPAPDTAQYYDVQLTEELRHTVRIPSPVVLGKLVRLIPADVMPALLVAAQGDLRGLVAIQGHAPEVVALLGALVGASWANETHELEAELRGGDYLAYGEEVVEELYEAGISLGVLARLAATILQEIGASAAALKEAERLVPFSPQRRGVGSSSTSTSASPTSGTPGGGTS